MHTTCTDVAWSWEQGKTEHMAGREAKEADKQADYGLWSVSKFVKPVEIQQIHSMINLEL